MASAASSSVLVKDKLPLRMMSTVVRGFKRGSTELGIPTANLDRESGKFAGGAFDDLPTGIYWGFCRIGEDDYVYKTACSIGYNPTYNNTLKTVGTFRSPNMQPTQIEVSLSLALAWNLENSDAHVSCFRLFYS